ncbi:hypothetical protein [Brevundimonas sp. NIBR11]|uniref:hypothetical protein n=1 Tax=Brevundimonas sp. NIBR11 TaxID=3015999 RepID=UPI0022F03EE2|nr:hypothetical protein [Brevundimonas sp. NIBR11]WGM31942.1 hypothetical protein KKHFBJBL_02193 [Brevundimonas sp. NIBR11]
MMSMATFMGIVAVLMLAVVILQIMLRGPMPVGRRLLVERAMMWLLATVAVCWLMRGAFAAVEGDMLWAPVSAVIVVSMIGQGLILWRKPTRADGTRT